MIKFDNLWKDHPTIKDGSAPCTTGGKKNFDDQCAMRLGVSLAASGVDTTKLVSKGRHCWYHKTSEGHVLAAEELAAGLEKYKTSGLGTMKKVNTTTFPSELSGKTGIIFFKDFWTRKGEEFTNRSGDHIDLWKKSRLTNWKTWFMISSILNTSGDFAKSREVWFWEVR